MNTYLLVMNLPIELYQLILSKSDFLTQIRLCQANTEFQAKLEIHDFMNIGCKYYKRLTNDILQLHPFITKLDTRFNTKITNIESMMRLVELNIWDHKEITNLNCLTRLEKLWVGGLCGVNDEGIINLTNLKKITAYGNPRITNLNHMTQLEYLNVGDACCGIGDAGIYNLTSLTELNASSNKRITNVNHMARLEILYADWDCGINTSGISQLRLKRLIAEKNFKITKPKILNMEFDTSPFYPILPSIPKKKYVCHTYSPKS